MTAYTTLDKLPIPEHLDTAAPLEEWFEDLATAAQAALLRPGLIASDAQRDTIIPAPVQGQRIWRSDKGWHEMYYAAYSASANPVGAKTAGWYPMPGQGPLLVATAAASQTVTTSSGRFGWATPTTNLGFTFATANGTVGMPYEGIYELILNFGTASTGTSQAFFRDSSGGGAIYASMAGFVSFNSAPAVVALNAGQGLSPFASCTTAGTIQTDRTFLSARWVGVRQS